MLLSISASLFAVLSCVGLLSLRQRYRLRRLTQTVTIPQEIKLWQEIATGLFASSDEELDRDQRMQLILRSGLQRLGISCGIITINDHEKCLVQSLVSAKNAVPEWLRAGREISLALTYCGLLGASRESLAIQYASLSDWRLHTAHRDLGWETFIGARRTLASGNFLTVSFFDWTAREQVYSAEEKAFVGQLANWIAAIYEAGDLQSGTEYLSDEADALEPIQAAVQ